MPEIDVAIAGAGPAGLMLACDLRLWGVDVMVLERQVERDERLRAEGITRVSLDALDRRGLLDRLWEHLGVGPAASAKTTRRHTEAAVLEAADCTAAGRTVSAWVVPGVRQQAVERVLEERAIELGAEVRRGRAVVGLAQDADGVRVDVRERSGTTTTLEAGWLVGADGGRSEVRRLAGIASSGTDPTITGYQAVVTVQAPAEPPALAPGWHRTPTGIVSWGPGRYRVVSIEFDRPPRRRDVPVTLEEVQASLRRTSGMDLTLTEPRSLARFSDATRLADSYRHGRVLLAGDAAHSHPPSGGQGLNLALMDAANLGWKLAGLLQGWAPPSLLDTYQSERRPVASRVLRNSLAEMSLLHPDERMTPAFELYNEIKSIQEVRPYLLDLISMTHHCYDMGVPDDQAHRLLGRATRDLSLKTLNGRTRLALLHHSGRGVLLDLADRPDLRDAAAGWAGRIDVVTGHCAEQDGLDALLVRPDGYVAWVCPSDAEPQPGPLVDALRRWFGDACRPSWPRPCSGGEQP